MLMQTRLKYSDNGVVLRQGGAEQQENLPLELAIERARIAVELDQHADGHWLYELEADCTIPAEYILMMHFMNEIDAELERKIAVYLRERQAAYGGWPLYHGGEFDMSCSVKAYFALKLAGDQPNEPHMRRARETILAKGGAAYCNVFTRISLALFEQVPWRAVPFIPVEIMLLPKWFPFHISKVSYWSRTVMVPLFILCTLKPKAANPKKIGISELFITPPDEEKNYFRPKTNLCRLFFLLDRFGRALDPLIPSAIRKKALKKAEEWFVARLNGEDGLGGIFPAMVNAYESLALLGYPADHPHRLICKKAIDKLLVEDETKAYCQPCLSPVWDTGLACHALFEANRKRTNKNIDKAISWLKSKQLNDEPGDWQDYLPAVNGGGWPFQYANSYYPDLDDTSMVGWLLYIVDNEAHHESIERATAWVWNMRSKNGGFASFDANNTHYYLNSIPFADHGALLDPPTGDVSARCVALLALVNKPEYAVDLTRAIEYLKADQEKDGSWYGRWGTNYIYGTWSVLSALQLAGEDSSQPYIRRAVEWLTSIQHIDGGWGESNDSYYPGKQNQPYPSTTFQTAWAILALLAAGEVMSIAVRRGIEFLLKHQQYDGLWSDESFTAPGFPRVFYLRYHGYTKYFPLWALAQYRNLLSERVG